LHRFISTNVMDGEVSVEFDYFIMNWRLVLLIIFILEGIYYLTNRLLFHRTFREINYWEWIIVIMIIPVIFGYLYIKQGN